MRAGRVLVLSQEWNNYARGVFGGALKRVWKSGNMRTR